MPESKKRTTCSTPSPKSWFAASFSAACYFSFGPAAICLPATCSIGLTSRYLG